MFTSIVVGTDGSPTAREAVDQAAGIARMSGARLHLVSAYRRASETIGAGLDVPMLAAAATVATDEEVRDSVESMLVSLARDLEGLEVTTYAIPGNPAQALLDVAANEKADLIVLGNRGMKGARRILGSVPNNVAHHAGCAVMIVPTC